MKLDISELKCQDHNKLVTIYCASCDKYFCKTCDTEKHQSEEESFHMRGLVNKETLGYEEEEEELEEKQVKNLRKSKNNINTILNDIALKSPMKKDSPYYSKDKNEINSSNNIIKKDEMNLVHEEDDPFEVNKINNNNTSLIDVNELSDDINKNVNLEDDENYSNQDNNTNNIDEANKNNNNNNNNLKSSKDDKIKKTTFKKNYKKDKIIGDSDEEQHILNNSNNNYDYDDGDEEDHNNHSDNDSNNNNNNNSNNKEKEKDNKIEQLNKTTNPTINNKNKEELVEQTYEEEDGDEDDRQIRSFKNPYDKSFKSNSCALEEGEEDDYEEEEQEKEAAHVVQGIVEGAIYLGTGIATGLSGVVAEPIIGAKDEGAKGFFKGVAKGISGVALNPVKGASGFLTKTAEGLRNTPTSIFTTKEDEIMGGPQEPLKEKEAAHIFEGFYQGTVSLGKGVFNGVTGIVLEPIKGVKDDGAKGFFKGVGKGLLGVVVKPVSGAIDFVAKPIEGLANSPNTVISLIENRHNGNENQIIANDEEI